MFHLDVDGNWTQQDINTNIPAGAGGNTMLGVDGLDGTTLYAAGTNNSNLGSASGSGILMKTVDGGTTWTHETDCALAGVYFTDVWVESIGKIWITGHSRSSGTRYIWSWDGVARTEEDSRTSSDSSSIWGSSATDIYVPGGSSGNNVYKYFDGSWNTVNLAGWTDHDITTIGTGYDATNVAIIGSNHNANNNIRIARGSHGSWTEENLATNFYHNLVGATDKPISVDSAGNIYVISRDTVTGFANIATYGGEWVYSPLENSHATYDAAICCLSSTDGLAVFPGSAAGIFRSWVLSGAFNWVAENTIPNVTANVAEPKSIYGYLDPAATGTATDLQTKAGVKRNIFAKIHGYEPILWQYSDLGEPSGAGWDRSIVTCLRAPSELSMGLNLAEGVVDVSGLTLEIDNVKDTDTTYRFAKEFAPAAWESGGWTRQRVTIEPTDTTFFIANPGADIADSAGELHVGGETVSYTGTTDTGADTPDGEDIFTIDGIVRDLYPAIAGTSMGKRYKISTQNEKGSLLPISTLPFTYAGRVVAVYVVTWNQDQEKWNDEDDAVLVWTGRISDSIEFDGANNLWMISCESLIGDLNQKIATRTRNTRIGRCINLNGWSEESRTIRIETYRIYAETKAHGYTCLFQVPAQMYTPEYLIWTINVGLGNNANWTDNIFPDVVQPQHSNVWLKQEGNFAKFEIQFFNAVREEIWFNEECHVLQALGFDVRGSSKPLLTNDPDGAVSVKSEYRAPKEFYRFYLPLRQEHNGGLIQAESVASFMRDAGDRSDEFETTNATIRIKNVKSGEDKITGYFRYKEIGSETVWNSGPDVDTLVVVSPDYLSVYPDKLAFAGGTDADPPPEIEQVFMPWPYESTSVARGPFAMALSMIISTGCVNSKPGQNYSGSGTNYDILHDDYGIGVPQQLVDIASFEKADEAIRSTDLYGRLKYPIQNESVMDIVKKECKLFGYALTWRDNKFTITKTMPPNSDVVELTINESVIADPSFQPKLTMSTGTVINQYNCNVNFNMTSNKFEGATVISDADSISSLQQTRSTRIEHKGIYHAPGERVSPEALTGQLVERFIRYPMPTISIPLAPTLINQIYVGDTVLFVSDKCPDPFGAGTLTTSANAIVINLSWDFKNWLGNCTLLLLAQAATTSAWWAASALVDQTATNGGWDAGNYQLTLIPYEYGDSSTDDKDGDGFAAGEFVRVIEKDPDDPSTQQNFGPFEVDSAFETDGDNLLTLVNTTTMATWDSTKEYVVLPGNYDEVTASQQGAMYVADNNYFVDGTTRGSLFE
jgi:hypothetical protein